jgi:hypothetical protein
MTRYAKRKLKYSLNNENFNFTCLGYDITRMHFKQKPRLLFIVGFHYFIMEEPSHHVKACIRFKQYSNTKSIVKVEAGIVTLILYHHYLKIVGNNKLWPHMQKESWNIHGTKLVGFCFISIIKRKDNWFLL